MNNDFTDPDNGYLWIVPAPRGVAIQCTRPSLFRRIVWRVVLGWTWKQGPVQ